MQKQTVITVSGAFKTTTLKEIADFLISQKKYVSIVDYDKNTLTINHIPQKGEIYDHKI